MYGGPGRDRTDEPPACKAGALPTELQAHDWSGQRDLNSRLRAPNAVLNQPQLYPEIFL